MTIPPAPEPQRPRLSWLRFLGVALAGLSAITVAAWLQATIDSSVNFTHTRFMVVLGLIFICGPAGVACFWTWRRLSGRYDTAENYVDKQSAFVLRQGPDLANPEEIFVEGGYMFEVQVLPALAPLGSTRGDGTAGVGADLLRAIYFVAMTLAVRRFDRRAKVVVSRRLRAAAHLWHAVQVDLFVDAQAADARATEIVSTWDPAAFAALEPLTRSQLRAARRAER